MTELKNNIHCNFYLLLTQIKFKNSLKILEEESEEIKELNLFNLFILNLYLILREFENKKINLDFIIKSEDKTIYFYDNTVKQEEAEATKKIYNIFYEFFIYHLQQYNYKYYKKIQNYIIFWNLGGVKFVK